MRCTLAQGNRKEGRGGKQGTKRDISFARWSSQERRRAHTVAFQAQLRFLLCQARAAESSDARESFTVVADLDGGEGSALLKRYSACESASFWQGALILRFSTLRGLD